MPRVQIIGVLAFASLVCSVAGGTTSSVQNESVREAPVVPLKSGVITGTRADGAQLEIDGKWYVVKRGRTQVMRKDAVVGLATLTKGQKVRYRMASAVVGESALEVVYVL